MRLKSRPELGFGLCLGGRGLEVRMGFVDIPGVAEHIVMAPERDVIDASLPIGTRVWVAGTSYGWHPGVIRSHSSGHRHHVDLPGIPTQVLSHQQFVVRWGRPLADSTLAVAHGMVESPGYYDARSGMLAALTTQRQVSRGITAPLSAPIELFHHQIDTAARVLADPVMRYLLADEVGLGKTIEAGLVARQLLIENSSTRVLVLCPENLVGQWRAELQDKLGLTEQLRTGAIVVEEHARAASRAAGLNDFDLIIVDEAHKFLRYVPPGSNVEWALRSVDGLLALSATPMRGDLSTFRRLLALVDPVAFADVSQEAFLARLDERETAAQDIQVLVARRATLRQKTSALESVLEDFGDDSNVVDLAADCRRSGDPRDDCWSELAEYVREVHRLSRRMIRHRRDGEQLAAYTVAGRFPTFVEVNDPARNVVDSFLESLRRTVASPDSDAFARAVECSLAGPRPLRDALLSALKSGAEDNQALYEITVARLEMAGVDSRLDAAVRVVKDRIAGGLKVVVVSAFACNAARFEGLIRESLGSGSVFTHFADDAATQRDAAVAGFLRRFGGAVLVADQSMEEGRNLQAAQVLVNLDLPLDANRLDQRIGRLDRYVERSDAAEVVVLNEPQSDWVSAHIDLLHHGVGVLNTSVSTVQRLLAATLHRVVRELVAKGADAFRVDAEELREALDGERDAIDLLEELESVSAATMFTPEAFVELVEVDEDSQPLRSALRRLTHGTGSLALGATENADGILEFVGANKIGLPVDEATRVQPLLQPKALSRAVAVHVPDVSPFRVGDPLVDWLQRYLLADERGRASAVVRPVAGISAPMMWLHSEFMIEFDAGSTGDAAQGAGRRLKRRGESHFRPFRVGIWADPSGEAPATVLQILQTPHAELRDEVLRGRVWRPVLKAFPDWARLCLDSADAAREALRESDLFKTAVRRSVEDAASDTQRRTAILEARARRLASPQERAAAAQELELEEAAGEVLRRGTERPLIRTVASAVCVLWPEADY